MTRDDYTKFAEALDKAFPNASVRIDTSGQTDTLLVDVHGIDTSLEEVRSWVTNRDNRRNVFGFGEKHLTFSTEPEGNDKLLVAVEDNT